MLVKAQGRAEQASAPASDQVREAADLALARGWVERQDRRKLE
jgi:hypothetical protein